MSHTITICPWCHKDFMYHWSDEQKLARNMVIHGKIQEVVVCWECHEGKKSKLRRKRGRT